MSLNRKLFWALLLLALLIAAVSLTFASMKSYSRVNKQVAVEMTNVSSQLLSLLQVTDSIMSERVQGSMRLLKDNASALGNPERGSEVQVGEQLVANVLLGDYAVANDYTLVDQVTAILGGQPLYLADVVKIIFASQLTYKMPENAQLGPCWRQMVRR